MSETITKVPFDPIPVGGSAVTTSVALTDPPRPSFSRSAPDAPVGGLLPPSRKPAAVTTAPAPLPAGIAPETPPPTPEDNPAPGTPPPNPTAVRGFFLDLFKPNRAKGAVAAGLVSLFAGAYGLNLVMPTPVPTDPKKTNDPAKETAKGPMPSVHVETVKPGVTVERDNGVRPVSHQEPAPLPPLGGGAGGGMATAVPLASGGPTTLPPTSTTIPIPEAKPLPLPSPTNTEWGSQGGGRGGGTPPLNQLAEKPKPLPLPAEATKQLVPPAETGRLDQPIVPQPKAEAPPLPKPLPFNSSEQPVEQPKAGLPSVSGEWGTAGGKTNTGAPPLPALPAVDSKPLPLPAVPGTTPTVGSVEQPKNPFGDKKDVAAVPLPVGLPQPKPDLPQPKNEIGGGDGQFRLPPASLPTAPETSAAKPLPLPASPEVPPRRVAEVGLKNEGFPPVVPLPAPGAVSAPPAVIPVAGARAEVPGVAPTVSASPPKTDFDVDVIRVRSADTYSSLSEQVYGTKQYAAALKAFNGGADLGQLREVMAPPMHVIRKQAGGRDRDRDEVIPAGGVRGPVLDAPVQSDTAENVDWGAPGKRRATVKYEKFTTPREGMTAREVAKAVYDDEREWAKLTGPRGARLRADDPLPRGTEVTVPREELPWK